MHGCTCMDAHAWMHTCTDAHMHGCTHAYIHADGKSSDGSKGSVHSWANGQEPLLVSMLAEELGEFVST